MNNHKIEIVVHVDETMSQDDQDEMLKELSARDGIVDARFTPKRPHLVVVDYDAEQLHALDILKYVKNRNVHAELIGGV